MKEQELEIILENLWQGEIDIAKAQQQILRLFSVSWPSEQLKCDCECPVPYKDSNNILACRKCHNEI